MTNIFEELKADYNVYPYNTKFVIQEHDASSLHFDLRIKKGNTAPSWAIPKAHMPTKTNEKYLAVKTPNHSVSYMNFSGEIPKDQYGGGTVKIYDSGKCTVYAWSRNYVVVKFMGNKVKGFYALIHMKEDQWLITYMNQEKAIDTYEKNKVSEGIVSENVFHNTLFTFHNETNEDQVLCIDDNTKFMCNLDEDTSLALYIEDTFNIKPSSIQLVDEHVECIRFNDIIEENIQYVYKIYVKDNITLTENVEWINLLEFND